MSNRNFRRKWSFEKGRNSGTAIFAAALTAASVAAVLGIFHYDYRSPDDRRQSTKMSVIDPEGDPAFFDMLDLRDPARTYGINGGGFGELLDEHRFDMSQQEDRRPEIPDYPPSVPEVKMAKGGFSGSMSAPVPLPDRAASVRTADRRPKVIASDGSVAVLPFLAEMNRDISGGESVIRISGGGVILNSEVVRSCGNAETDARAETALKAAGVAPGLYIVNWPGRKEKKP